MTNDDKAAWQACMEEMDLSGSSVVLTVLESYFHKGRASQAAKIAELEALVAALPVNSLEAKEHEAIYRDDTPLKRARKALSNTEET